jgi:hypothetical protein
MMVIKDFQLLAYLHDAKCSEVAWDCTSPDCRTIRLSVTAHVDTGFPSWDGSNLRIIISDVVAVRFLGWGFVIGDEFIDSWRVGVSDYLEGECKSLAAKGIAVPPSKFSISFSSGSILELVCSEVSIGDSL